MLAGWAVQSFGAFVSNEVKAFSVITIIRTGGRNDGDPRDMVEIRWHGRGGQGAKTACLLLAEVAGIQGKFVQGFPEYGPGAWVLPLRPTTASARNAAITPFFHPMSRTTWWWTKPCCRTHSVDVTAGLKADGAIIINTTVAPKELRSRLRGWSGKVCAIDARHISENAGANRPNTPMLAALVKVSGVLDTGAFLADIEESFRNKFARQTTNDLRQHG